MGANIFLKHYLESNKKECVEQSKTFQCIKDESQIPAAITNQFENLSKLENNIQKSVDSASNAKQKAENAKISVGLFKKKKAIELLQDAAFGLAEAQISAADSQKLLFEYQTELTKICEFLLKLGTSNLAMNRSVVRELELKLKGADGETLSELAQQELQSIVNQLLAQQDIMEKQEKFENCLTEQSESISLLGKQVAKIDSVLLKHEEENLNTQKNIDNQKIVLSDHTKKIENLEDNLMHQEELEKKQSEQIALLMQESEKSKTLFNEKNVSQDHEISLLKEYTEWQKEIIATQTSTINELQEKIKDLQIKLEQKGSKIALLAVGIGTFFALILSIVLRFI